MSLRSLFAKIDWAGGCMYPQPLIRYPKWSLIMSTDVLLVVKKLSLLSLCILDRAYLVTFPKIHWLNIKEVCRGKLMSSSSLRKHLMKLQFVGFLKLDVPTKYQMLLGILPLSTAQFTIIFSNRGELETFGLNGVDV